MTDIARETWITGVGLVSCLGEGPEAHWAGFNMPPPQPDAALFAPYSVHRIGPLEFERQIPKRGDLRQMEPWQRIGTYAAGLALESAGIKGNADVLARLDLLVAAGAGERDQAVDASILAGLGKAERPHAYLNERLLNDLRPTLFLAQLSNLLAGNIAIVHGVTGSSRTFMGEEAAGVDALRTAQTRIAAGQSEVALIGGATNAENLELVLRGVMGRALWQGAPACIWERAATGGGMTLGSMGAFLVLEECKHARSRGAAPLARLRTVSSGRVRRDRGVVADELERQWTAAVPGTDDDGLAIISGASGCQPAASEERAFLMRRPACPVRATAGHVGHAIEPQFAFNVALAAVALNRGRLFPTFDPTGVERAMDASLRRVVVTGVGHRRGEGLALLEAVREAR